MGPTWGEPAERWDESARNSASVGDYHRREAAYPTRINPAGRLGKHRLFARRGVRRADALLVERRPQGDAVDNLQERLGARVNDVGADTPAGEHLAVVLDLDQ